MKRNPANDDIVKAIIEDVEAHHAKRMAAIRKPDDKCQTEQIAPVQQIVFTDYDPAEECSLRHGLLLLVIAGLSRGNELIRKLFSRRNVMLVSAVVFISLLTKSCTGNDGSHWLGLGVVSLLLILVMTVYAHPDRFSLK